MDYILWELPRDVALRLADEITADEWNDRIQAISTVESGAARAIGPALSKDIELPKLQTWDEFLDSLDDQERKQADKVNAAFRRFFHLDEKDGSG